MIGSSGTTSEKAESRDDQKSSAGPLCAHIKWKAADERPAVKFAMALISLLFDATDNLRVSDLDGREFDELELDECIAILRKGRAVDVHCEFAEGHRLLGDHWTLHFSQCNEQDASSRLIDVSIHTARSRWEIPANRSRYLDFHCLQTRLEFRSPLPVLAVPVDREGIVPSALHGLIGLASRCGDFDSAQATLSIPVGEPLELASWHSQRPSSEKRVLPVVGINADALWLTDQPSEYDPLPVAWVEYADLESPYHFEEPNSDELRSAIASTIEQNSINFAALNECVWRLVPDAQAVRFAPLNEVPFPPFMSHPHEGIVSVIAPKQATVHLGLSVDLDSDLVVDVVLHALGHILLGHIRPGDEFGHWDTIETVCKIGTPRRWDRQVAEHFADWFEKPRRIVNSLEECTPHEKACLGLWRMIGETLGKSRRLHHKAEQYQAAAYQRQAAQRILSQLVDYDGAMLCDGVGLGKTYVATTLLVHFANEWRDQFRDKPEGLLKDPYRITVLSPNSVVSTWRREALPPLGFYGVPLATIRVVSHSRLSRISASSEVLSRPGRNELSDLEHLLLSDLVIVDEAHNFRSLSASRTKVLRDLLRLQPRKEQRRRVLLLTATPINNSLEDLRQEVSLLFSRPLFLSDAKTDTAYRRQAVQEVAKRCEKAREPNRSRSDVAAFVIHGQPDARFSDTVEFRDDLDFGPNVQRIGAYLKEQDKRLKELQDEIRAAAQAELEQDSTRPPVRIADELLDRIVVQRSRSLCKQIELQQGSAVNLLFRADSGPPEKLHYSDEYDGIRDVLASFLPLFDSKAEEVSATSADSPDSRALSLKVYMWYDVREGIKDPDDTSSVVGLQRVLVLKRLESSPVSFLITLLRLTVLHAYRLEQLRTLCRDAENSDLGTQLRRELDQLLDSIDPKQLDKIRTLATGDRVRDPKDEFFKRLSDAHGARTVADADEVTLQLSLFERDEEVALEKETQLQRLWPLKEWLVRDLQTLLHVTPRLADIVFGKFNRREWPHNFIAGGDEVDWPASAAWAMRVVTDAKIRRLVARLIEARRQGQKVIVFSQFTDSLAYVQSILRACREFTHADWASAADSLGPVGVTAEEVQRLIDVTQVVTGDTVDREQAVNSFAPYYRIGPLPPFTEGDTPLERQKLSEEWKSAWRSAILDPVDVLLSTDVLAEGVNLQDAAVLINFDVHWNPVRMIQRSGRIDRRLNPRIENQTRFEDLEAMCQELGHSVPVYYWHSKVQQAPLTVNMILPDELEQELLLRERIATKTLAIDFTLGLEQGTGAEADWLANYKYQGVSSLNAFQKDRAIEQVASFHAKFAQMFHDRQIVTSWVDDLNGWFQINATDELPLAARVSVCPYGTADTVFGRYLEPAIKDGIPHWLWSEDRPNDSILNFWIRLDGETPPPVPTAKGLRWHENASRPLRADDLLNISILLDMGEDHVVEREPDDSFGRLQQGIAAVTAGRFSSDEDREELASAISSFLVLQYSF